MINRQEELERVAKEILKDYSWDELTLEAMSFGSVEEWELLVPLIEEGHLDALLPEYTDLISDLSIGRKYVERL
jgi:hypothetical protein